MPLRPDLADVSRQVKVIGCLWDEDEESCLDRITRTFAGVSVEALGDWTMCPACRALWHLRCAEILAPTAAERRTAINTRPQGWHPSIGAHRADGRQLSLL